MEWGSLFIPNKGHSEAPSILHFNAICVRFRRGPGIMLGKVEAVFWGPIDTVNVGRSVETHPAHAALISARRGSGASVIVTNTYYSLVGVRGWEIYVLLLRRLHA